MNPRPLFFPHINFLRAFAALSILVYHVIVLFPWKNFPSSPFVMRWFISGWMAVDLFFVISGFVIMLSVLRLNEAYNYKRAQKIFMIRRLARICPLYFLTCIIFIVFVRPQILLLPGLSFHLITHLLFIHNWFYVTHGSINGPNWSVAVEMQFYMLIFLFWRFFSKVKVKSLMVIALFSSLVTRTIVYFLAQFYHKPPFWEFIYAAQVPGMLDEFAMGMVLAKMVFKDFYFLQRLRKTSNYMLLFLFTGFFVFCIQFIYWKFAQYWNFWFMAILWRPALGYSFFLILLWAVLIPATNKTLSNIIYRIFFYLGEISYGIYLWQLPIILSLKRAGIKNPHKFLFLTLLFVVVFSVLSWEFLEKPLIKIARKYKG